MREKCIWSWKKQRNYLSSMLNHSVSTYCRVGGCKSSSVGVFPFSLIFILFLSPSSCFKRKRTCLPSWKTTCFSFICKQTWSMKQQWGYCFHEPHTQITTTVTTMTTSWFTSKQTSPLFLYTWNSPVFTFQKPVLCSQFYYFSKYQNLVRMKNPWFAASFWV